MKNKLILSLLCATAISSSAGWATASTIKDISPTEKWESARSKIAENFKIIDSKIKKIEAATATTTTASAPTLKKAAAVGASGYYASGTSRNLFTDEDRKTAVAATRGTNTGGKEYWTLDDGTILRGDGTEMKPTKIDGINYYKGKDGKFYTAKGTDSGIKEERGNVIGRKGDKWNGTSWEAVAPTPPPPPPPPAVTYDQLGTSIYFKNGSTPTDTRLFTDSSGTKAPVSDAKFVDAAGTTPNYWLLNNGNGDLIRLDGTVMKRVDLRDGKFAYQGKGGSLSNADGTRYVETMKGSFKKDHYVDSKGRVYKDDKATDLDNRFSRTAGTDDAFGTFEFEKTDAAKSKKKKIATDGSQEFTAGEKATKGLKKAADGKVTNADGAEVTKGSGGLYGIPNLATPGGTSGDSTTTTITPAKTRAAITEELVSLAGGSRAQIAKRKYLTELSDEDFKSQVEDFITE